MTTTERREDDDMRGTELRDAYAALAKVRTLKHYRPETVKRAVGAVLAYVGAHRLAEATNGDSNGADTRKLVKLLDALEDAAVRLEQIPQRSDYSIARGEVWGEVLASTDAVSRFLNREQALTQIRLAKTG